jgi:glycosyltransferase involved in cell wall biosynthesis
MVPTVSVIMPAYNQRRYVGQAIDSVLSQTFADCEIIVINDGSTDETAQVLAGYGDRIRVVTQANSGPAAARNSGLLIAKGEMIAFLDGDDLWYPEMLASTVSHLQRNSDADLVSGAWDYIDSSGQTIEGATKPSRFQARIQADFLKEIALGNLFPVHALLVRRKCFDCCGLFDTSLEAMEDWDLWLRMAVHGHRADLIDIPVARYRRHSGCRSLEPKRSETGFHQVLAKLFSDERVATHLADLRTHAYVAEWLFLAEHCYRAGLNTELSRCISMAEELYQTAPFNEELSRRFFFMAARLPRTESFVKVVSASMPELLVYYYWISARQSSEAGRYRSALQGLVKLTVRSPGRLVRRTFLRIGQSLF